MTTIQPQPLARTDVRVNLRKLIALTKPGVTGLLVFTAMATALAGGGAALSLGRLLLLGAAGALASGGASALNHYFEREVDAQMPRTAGRPLPSGMLVPPVAALVWGLGLCLAGVALAVLTLPIGSAIFIALGILIYVPLYTLFLKRRSVLNIVIGGAAGSCAVLAGWAAADSSWTLTPLALAATVFFWTPAHFWAFAILHDVEYRLAGFPMLPSVVGSQRAAPYIFLHASLTVVASLLALRGLPLGLVAIPGAVLLVVCVRLWRKPDRSRARSVYMVSNYYLITAFSALLLVQ
jgi:protoheme IX farnesyltransferase